MSGLASELITIAFFVVVGWVALWPMRERLGPVSYHLAALPVGLLSAALAGAVSTVTGRPIDAVSASAGGLLLVVVLWAIQLVVVGRNRPTAPNVGARSFAVSAGVLGFLGVLFGVVRFTVSNNDSFISYWPLGVELSRTGAFTAQMMSARSPLIPSMNAIHATLGSDWAYVVYPLLGATLALWVAHTLWTGPLAGSGMKMKVLLAGGTAGFLLLEGSYLFHSFFVHSHMVSAIYLLMSLTCVWAALPFGRTGDPDEGREAYLVLAGLFASGLALARPDGLAYQFVPVAVAIAGLTVAKVRWREVTAFFTPFLFVVLGSYASAYAGLGMWASSKLSGRTALAILAVLALSVAGPWIVQALDRALPFRLSGERFLGILTAVAAALMLVVFVLQWDTARGALATARINLFEGMGGYHYLWYAVVALLTLSIFTGDALRSGSWTRWAFLSVALFFVIAGLIHGTSHEGRVGVGDSFNRVAFHALPVAVWFVGAVMARILGPARSAEER